MNIEEMAEKIIAVKLQNPSIMPLDGLRDLIATTLRDCLAKSAGVELRATVRERDDAFHQELESKSLLQFGIDAACDIDSLITAIAARDAEIEKLKAIAAAAVEFVKASEAIQSATLDNMASAMGMEQEAYGRLKSAIDGGKL